MSAAELLGALRPEQELSPFQRKIDALLETLRNQPRETFDVEIAVDGVVYAVTLTALLGHEWNNLTATCPPREDAPADLNHGFDPHKVIERYPDVRVDGEEVEPEVWAEIARLLDASTRLDLASAAWWVHEGRPRQELASALAKQEEAQIGR